MADATRLTDDGAWCWFQEPRARRHVGAHDRTYTGWMTREGDVVVGSYDHDTDETTGTVLHPDFEEDDHDAPTFFVDREGRVLVFYTGHHGPKIHFRRSEASEDLSAFGPERTIAPSDGHTYPNPRRIGDRLYLFYRNGTTHRDLAYVVSDDDGRSWSDERTLVTLDRGTCVYFKISAVHDGAVDVGMTYAEGGGHQPHRDVRHVQFDGETVRTADGTVAGDGDTVALWDTPLVYDSGATGNDAWIWDCSAAGGLPELVYAELRSEEDHAYRYARWTGSEWRDRHLAEAGRYITRDNPEQYYSGGICLDHERPGVCYYAAGDHDGSELVRAETGDGGATWTHTTLAAADSQNVRPVVPRNRHDDLGVLWMQGPYTLFSDRHYDTAIVGTTANS